MKLTLLMDFTPFPDIKELCLLVVVVFVFFLQSSTLSDYPLPKLLPENALLHINHFSYSFLRVGSSWVAFDLSL